MLTLSKGAFLGKEDPKLSFLPEMKADGDYKLCSRRLEPGHARESGKKISHEISFW